MSEDQETRERMQEIGRVVQAKIPPGWGFVVIVFPFEDREGLLNYIANAKREAVVKMLKEFIEKTERSWATHQEDAI